MHIVHYVTATPIDYFELVTNPDSYGHTVENIFHLAFLVKDGLVKVFLNDNGIPVVELVGTKESAMGGKDQSKKASTEACSQVRWVCFVVLYNPVCHGLKGVAGL